MNDYEIGHYALVACMYELDEFTDHGEYWTWTGVRQRKVYKTDDFHRSLVFLFADVYSKGVRRGMLDCAERTGYDMGKLKAAMQEDIQAIKDKGLDDGS